jgi:hypothetical protein
MRPLAIGKGAAGFREIAARVLPEFVKGKSPTTGVGALPSGHLIRVVSGNKKEDSALIDIVNDRLRKAGFLKTAKSARASDAEQKMAAVMIRDDIKKADIVINNPAGPCAQPLGCHRVLPAILGERQLTVHWPNGKGGWEKHTYGGAG